ncbi:MAG: D-alanyl-D-alanine carboxypeptidase family protein [Candidatus Pacebacteria bacterium]|nr:D-alanyl-D-alanine carboxypeptidase family protein [Candidatus Paceibacterota bacterium]
MKKISIYILIIITLVGILTPVMQVNAVYGTCWLKGKVEGKSPYMTPNECTNKKGDWQDDGTPLPPKPNGPDEDFQTYNKGTCWYRENAIGTYPNMTPNECTEKSGEWQDEGEKVPGPPNGPRDGLVPPGGAVIVVTPSSYPDCTTAATNLKDGWGWENGKSCKITEVSIFSNCTDAATNLKDGWGWENGKSCKDNFYYPLAPLTLDGTDGKFDPSQKNALGAYLNMMMKLIIGLASVMAVVMIVIGGVEYMTSDLVFSKESAKQRISEAVLGLLVALGAYALLNTINPDLLQTDLDTLGNIKVEVDLETPIVNDVGTPPGKTTSCAEGIVKTTINMFACANIVQNINLLLSDSRAAKLNITGGGYRSYEEQKRLRIANCNGNFTSKEAFCKPLTALPGESNHNNGKAFDLRCDGQTIRTTDNKCYIWLTANASKYGLRNLNGEPWHWSVDGR